MSCRWQFNNVRFPSSTGANSVLIPISTKSNLALMLSFDFPSTFSSVPIMQSNTFFSICIASRKCLTYNDFQYGSSKKIDFFFHPLLTRSFAKGLPNLLLISFTFSNS
ncbi:hypothetical protein MtrunA17_Chr1g0174641 [Medicago truncatula]|uniref:Uncharacterized protein n=1 Tax=Medicago truncatula TaxID=3880 RepID=A0A396JSJ1_MEDTR|nr:hypothetical protein MtrunA17_Chr1g0174641 [Medicago truncatula]